MVRRSDTTGIDGVHVLASSVVHRRGRSECLDDDYDQKDGHQQEYEPHRQAGWFGKSQTPAAVSQAVRTYQYSSD